MRFSLAMLTAAGLGLAACTGPNPDPGAGNSMGEYRGAATTQAAPARTPVQPNGGTMAIAEPTGGMTVAAPARQAQQPQGGSMAIPPATGTVSRAAQ